MKKIIFSLMALFVAAFTFTSCESVPMPYDQPGTGGTPTETIEPTGSGTLEDPYNIAALLQYAATLGVGESSPKQIYFKGKVSSIKEITDATSYGNATFYVSDTGTAQNQFYVYRSLGLNNQKVTSTDLIKVGDEVIVCGIITNYNGTLETAQNKAYIHSINGEGGSGSGGETPSTVESKGTGTQTDPYNVAGILAYTKALAADVNSDNELYFSGVIESITSVDTGTYGNATFYIKDEDGTDKFYCFRVMGPGNKKFTAADQIKVGDKVVICGKVVNYKGNTPETVGNQAYVYSINGETNPSTGGGGTEEPSTPEDPGTTDGISIEGTTVTLTNANYTAGTTSVTVDLNAQGWANAADVTSCTAEDGTTITFAAGTGTTSPKFYTATKGVRMYANNTLTVTSTKNIAKVVINCDTYNGTNYVGNTTATMTANGGTVVYTNQHTENKGGVQCRPQTITITYAQ